MKKRWHTAGNNMFSYLVLREHLPYHSTGARALRGAFSWCRGLFFVAQSVAFYLLIAISAEK